MNVRSAISLIVALNATGLCAAPDFLAHGFASALPSSVKWELKQEFDDKKNDMVMRGYLNAEGARTIVLLLGKNNTDGRELATFASRYFGRLKQKQNLKVVSESSGLLAGLYKLIERKRDASPDFIGLL